MTRRSAEHFAENISLLRSWIVLEAACAINIRLPRSQTNATTCSDNAGNKSPGSKAPTSRRTPQRCAGFASVLFKGAYSAGDPLQNWSLSHNSMQLLKLPVSRTRLAVSRTRLAVSRTRLVVSRTRLAVPRTQLAVSRTQLAVSRRRLAVSRRRLAISRRRLAVALRRLAVARRRLAVARRRLAVSRTRLTVSRRRRSGSRRQFAGVADLPRIQGGNVSPAPGPEPLAVASGSRRAVDSKRSVASSLTRSLQRAVP